MCITPFSFATMLQQLRPHINAVYDVTVAYEGSTPLPLNIHHGILPSAVHIHVKRHVISAVPTKVR
jgi:hypothetical protein